jgi:hypothetical protein
MVMNVMAPPTGIKKKMAVSVAAQKVGEASPAAVDAGPPPEKTSERGEAPVATQKAGQRDDEKTTASMATQRVGETSSEALDARPLPGNPCGCPEDWGKIPDCGECWAAPCGGL